MGVQLELLESLLMHPAPSAIPFMGRGIRQPDRFERTSHLAVVAVQRLVTRRIMRNLREQAC